MSFLGGKRSVIGQADLHTQYFQYQRVEEWKVVDLAVRSGVSFAREIRAEFAAQTGLVLRMVI